ncbi:PKD domain-containing protein [Parabacteroides sp. PF5-9]|uniref:PKD domain-containing protein n=1 Tax=Parabacteroides sp. PF5-9 TaxID=1742404 RepID=UPI002472FF39|nr:PKD domain-containing protein [Parabacteroides sp. PF5-9]MDH6358499.1 hypothetical protein [Parabacteroides sp. PF5-9]
MRKYLFVFLAIAAVFVNTQAQKQAGHWYFGRNVGLDFINTRTVNDKNGVAVDGMPTLEVGPISTNEGCFTLSDADGNLIVASDGMKVYNKNKTQIASGLNGNTSSAQSGILIPYPETPGKYFIISNSCKILYYSIFDANANGGLGEVTNINTLVPQTTVTQGQLYENVTSQIHANGKDYWLLHRCGPYLFSWLITKNGMPSAPTVINNIPGTAYPAGKSSQGYMKLSPDGKKICHTMYDGQEVFFADFDNETGVISNVIIRKFTMMTAGFYSLEFSPQGKNLFLSYLNTPLYVIPVDDFETAAPTLISSELGTCQTGSDGRVYSIQSSGSSTYRFGVITNPDDDISSLNIHVFENFLNGSGAIWGLPSFAPSWFNVSLDGDDSFCENTPQTFNVTISTSPGADAVSHTEWDFGDGSPIITDTNISGTQSHTHTYDKKGVYTLTVRVFRQADGAEITNQRQRFSVKVASCVLPVNHNISAMEFY